MKRRNFALAIGLAFLGFAAVWIARYDAKLSDSEAKEIDKLSADLTIETKTEPHSAKQIEKNDPPKTSYSLLELEQYGRVPDGANERTWRLCEKTFWWGKRLDPDVFWSNRVVWLSYDAELTANRHGRRYPPIPTGNLMFLDRSDSDKANPLTTWEFRDRAYFSSNRERIYWNWRELNCPWPPEKIQFGLQRAADEWRNIRDRVPTQPVGLKIPPSSREERRAMFVSSYTEIGFPMEALEESVLDWEYVRCKRKERIAIVQEPDEYRRNILLETFNQRLACAESLVVSEPSDEEIRVTTGWRIEYLRRLRREGTDESYIEAYKKAWNLSEDDLKEAAE